MTTVRLADLNRELVQCWQQEMPAIEAQCRDIFSSPASALVSPSNSFGFMDGGIDLAYSQRFGWGVQHRLQDLIQTDFDGELLVGQAVAVDTGDAEFPWLIAAPTMRVPSPIADWIAVRLSTRAAVRCARRLGVPDMVLPGMGTLSGQVPPAPAARLMAAGIDDAIRTQFPASWREAAFDHFRGVA